MFMIMECFSSGENFTLFYMHDIGHFFILRFPFLPSLILCNSRILLYSYCLGELLHFYSFFSKIPKFFDFIVHRNAITPSHQIKDRNSSFKWHAPSPPTYFHLILSNVFYLKSNGNSQVRPLYFSVLKLRVTAPFYNFCAV